MTLDPLQITAVSIIVIFFLISLIGIGKEVGFFAQVSNIAPNTLTSIGIFFTFVGILVSLSNFDVSSINSAVPQLLSGLQLAFLSSVVGLFFSVIYRFIIAFGNRKNSAGDIGAGELYEELKRMNENTLLVRDALVGEGDSSLSTQFGKLRNDFRDFAEKMAEDGTQALVKALEEVISDFNQKINEQFGENFKQLNQAVAALLAWQEEYKNQVEILTEAFQKTQAGILSIEESTSRIPSHMESVEKVFKDTDTRVSELYDGIGSLHELRESAKNSVPELKESIDSMTTGMRKSIDSQLEILASQISETKNLSEDLGSIVKTSLDQTERNFQNQMEKFQGVLDSLTMGADNVLESTDTVAKRVNEIIDNFASNQERIGRDIQSKIDQSVADNVEAMNQSLQDLDKGMQQQLQRSIDKMGNNLTSITETFVTTYEDNARRIIELTKSINS